MTPHTKPNMTPKESEAAARKKTAAKELKEALKAFKSKDVGLMMRFDTNPVEAIAHPKVADDDNYTHYLFWYSCTVIGQTWKLIVYRLEGESFSKARYAILDEIHGYHQEVTIDELIEFALNPPASLYLTLEGFVRAVKEAADRVSETGRDLEHV